MFFKQNKWNIGKSFTNIQKFVKAAKKSEYELICFIDDGYSSEEAMEKWFSRREKEISGQKPR